MKKAIAILLLAAIAAQTIACGDNASGNETTSAEQNAESTTVLTGREAISDGLPQMDCKGADFNILTRTVYDYEFAAESENGELVNDAVYKRNGRIEERFNVNLKTAPTPCNWGDEATAFNANLRASILAGDGAYDLVAGYAATINNLVADEIFMNWLDLKYLDFTKPWWSERVADELSINGKCFMITGDISLALWKNMRAMFFNKKLAEDYSVGDIYSTVSDGKWTLDKLIELTKDVYADTDADGARSDGDTYGFLLGWDTPVDNMKEAFEIPVTKKGDDGFPVIAIKSERMIEAVEKINDYVHNSGSVLFPPKNIITNFISGLGLFCGTTLGKAENMRGMTDDFGILPYPKYNEEQETYHSTSLDEFSNFVVPIDAKNPDMTALLTEALCAESYKLVVPTFYDITLKVKGARDEESSAMIDLIRDGLTFDFGYLHSSAIDGVGHKFVDFIRNNNNNVVSVLDASMSGFEAKLEDVLKPYR